MQISSLLISLYQVGVYEQSKNVWGQCKAEDKITYIGHSFSIKLPIFPGSLDVIGGLLDNFLLITCIGPSELGGASF